MKFSKAEVRILYAALTNAVDYKEDLIGAYKGKGKWARKYQADKNKFLKLRTKIHERWEPAPEAVEVKK